MPEVPMVIADAHIPGELQLFQFIKGHEMHAIHRACRHRCLHIRTLALKEGAGATIVIKHFEGRGCRCCALSKAIEQERIMRETGFGSLALAVAL